MATSEQFIRPNKYLNGKRVWKDVDVVDVKGIIVKRERPNGGRRRDEPKTAPAWKKGGHPEVGTGAYRLSGYMARDLQRPAQLCYALGANPHIQTIYKGEPR